MAAAALSEFAIGVLLLLGLVALIAAGAHVAVALAVLSVLGVGLLRGDLWMGFELLALTAYDAIAHHVFGVVPLFVLMGFLVNASDLGRDSFGVAHRVFGRVRGGLGVATVAANAVFAAITGISIASAAVFTQVAVPAMRRLGYTPRFSVGVVAGSSVLGMLVPPSLLLIVYGLLAEVSIGALFLAGVGPGLLLAAAFATLILVMARLAPAAVGGVLADAAGAPPVPWRRGLAALAQVAALGSLVLGGIYGGWFTPSEAGAVGALASLGIALARGSLREGRLWAVLVQTGHTTVSICVLIIAANCFARVLALCGLPQALLGTLEAFELGPAAFLLGYLGVLIALGTVLDSTSILLIAVPLALPAMGALALDPVWVGVLTVLAVEVGLLTPPLGIAVYVIHGSLRDEEIPLRDIFVGAAPFAVTMVFVLAAVAIWPEISLGWVR